MTEFLGEDERGFGSPSWILQSAILHAPEELVRAALILAVGALGEDDWDFLPEHTAPGDFLLDLIAQIALSGVYLPTRCNCDECQAVYATEGVPEHLKSEEPLAPIEVDESLIENFREQLDRVFGTYNKEENNDE